MNTCLNGIMSLGLNTHKDAGYLILIPKLRFKTEYEQQIWGDCARLLTNCIIYYNAAILSDLLTYSDSTGDAARIALLSQISPVAWQHINFYGRYEFNRQPEIIDMKAILQLLANLPLR